MNKLDTLFKHFAELYFGYVFKTRETWTNSYSLHQKPYDEKNKAKFLKTEEFTLGLDSFFLAHSQRFGNFLLFVALDIPINVYE